MMSQDDRLLDLLGGLCNDNLSLEEERQLADLLRDEPDARRMYVRYMDVHLALTDLDLAGGELSDSLLVDALAEEETAGADFSVFPYSGDLLPLAESDVPDGRRFGLVSYFSQVGPLSYMVATVVMCAMLLTAWAYKITHTEEMVQDDGKPPVRSANDPRFEFVGRVTGMKDCVWAKDNLTTIVGASIPMGREYALSSGLLEITYSSGARVILEGPCSYIVDSDAGGYLGRGKLTARVEMNDELGIRNKELTRQESDIHHSSFINNRLFSVTTPTAVVTDLGTEFGVEVRENSETQIHVFQGKVRAEWSGQSEAADRIVELVAGQAAGFDQHQSAIKLFPTKPSYFIRSVPGTPARPVDVAAKKTIVKWSGVYRYGDPTKRISDWELLGRIGPQHVNDGVTDESVPDTSYWLGRAYTPDEYFIIYLRGRYLIYRVELMNTHASIGNDHGTKDFELWAADEMDQDKELVSPRLVLKGTLPCRVGAGADIPYDVYTAEDGDFAPFIARYVKFVAKTYYEGKETGGCGLNEIRLFTGSGNGDRKPSAAPAATDQNKNENQ